MQKNFHRQSMCWLLIPILVMFAGGCATSNQALITAAPEDADRMLSEGYTLLHTLLDKNSPVDKILFLKGGPADFKTLIVDIATACVEGAKSLEQLSAGDPRLSLEGAGLPVVEGQTRVESEKTSTKTLLSASGAEFQTRLIVEQIKAMSYASHLAGTLADMELDLHPDRALILRGLEGRFEQLHTRLMDRLIE